MTFAGHEAPGLSADLSHRCLVHEDAVLATPLRSIHREVGPPDQLLRVLTVAVEENGSHEEDDGMTATTKFDQIRLPDAAFTGEVLQPDDVG